MTFVRCMDDRASEGDQSAEALITMLLRFARMVEIAQEKVK
jgi:hypothetical protein